jgi:hypothetical protein
VGPLGTSLVILSCAFSWFVLALEPPSPRYATDLSIPSLFFAGPEARVPSLAQVLLVVGFAGLWVAAAGAALLMYSTALGWTFDPFLPPDVRFGFPATHMPFVRLFAQGSELRVPNIAQVLIPMGLLAAVALGARSPAADLGRRALGAFAVILAGLFVFRIAQFADLVPEGPGRFGLLQLGPYVAMLGGLILLLAPARRREPPVRAEDSPP